MARIYFAPHSRAIRVRWLLEELGLPYQLIPVDIHSSEKENPAYKMIHPLGMVPAVEIGEDVQFESGAICLRLSDEYSALRLAPQLDSPHRPKYLQWFFYACTTLEAPAFEFVKHAFLLPKSKRIPAQLSLSKAAYFRALTPLEAELADREYLLGDKFSTADIMVGSVLLWLPKLLKDFPSLAAYVVRLKSRSTYQQARRFPTD